MLLLNASPVDKVQQFDREQFLEKSHHPLFGRCGLTGTPLPLTCRQFLDSLMKSE